MVKKQFSFEENDSIKKLKFKRKRLYCPYSLKEALGWIYRYYRGPSHKNNGKIQYIPSYYELNKVNPKYILVFIGDIMDLDDNNLIIGESVKNFAKGCDFLIGNLEATITSEKRIFMDQRHKLQIIDALESLFPPNKIYLSVANNHAGDFGSDIFFDSVLTLEKRNFKIFGTKTKPYCDLTKDLRIIGGTTWNNRNCEYIITLKEIEQYLKPASFNILFPHWGYEIELYPRISIINLGKKLLKNFDAIIGHHSHCPQPITFEIIKKIKKLIAYSLGDFCFFLNINEKKNKFKSFQYGIVLKAELGTTDEGFWQFGKIEWKFIKTTSLSEKSKVVNITDKISL